MFEMRRLLGMMFGLLLAGQGTAQDLSTEQIRNFKKLPAAEQRQLLQAAGIEQAEQILKAEQQAKPVADVAKVLSEQEKKLNKDRIDSERDQRNAEQREAGQGLKLFGYELFAGKPDGFTPVSNVPIPQDYIMGPGDSVEIQLFGKENQKYSLDVDRDGAINFPGIAPISVIGFKFDDMKQLLTKKISEQIIGVESSITLGRLRSIQVFVLGEAYQPGSYTVNSLATMSNALSASGGIAPIGSLRNIQLKRQGQVLATLDLYQLLLSGDTSQDLRLQPGDVIFIPPVKQRVGIKGAVRRPAMYELLPTENRVQDLLKMAGGLEEQAYPRAARLSRLNADDLKTVQELDLSRAENRNRVLMAGDLLELPAASEQLDNVVELRGHVTRPGNFQWRKGLKISQLFPNMKADLLTDTDLNYALVVRTLDLRQRVKVLQLSLAKALTNPGSADNLRLEEGDKVLVFSRSDAEQRSQLLAPLLGLLRDQSNLNESLQVVDVAGAVKFPGSYPLTEGARVQQLIMAGGGLQESAYLLQAELSRLMLNHRNQVDIAHLDLRLQNAMAGDPGENLPLEARDRLTINLIPDWRETATVEILGQVRFPGQYSIRQGETLADVLKRAGGLTELAYSKAAIFTREDLKAEEAKRMAEMKSRLQADLAASKLADTNAASKDQAQQQLESLHEMQSLLNQLDNTEATGRLVIDLDGILAGDASANLVLKAGDTLRVPQFREEVTIIGEVQHPTSHRFQAGYQFEDYLKRSGGLTTKADKDKIYVVKANGSVELANDSSWFRSDNTRMEPGDTLVVPLDAERVKPLVMWTNVSQILFQLGTAAASLKVIGAL